MTVQRNGLIAKKELSATHVSGQDLATGDATPLEGLSTGAETGPVDSSIEKKRAVPPIRTQQMGRCSVQMIRLIDEPTPPVIEKPGQLFWTTPETDEAIKDLKKGPDVTKQRCSECGFRGTKKRVCIHGTQHFCRHFCECRFTKASRDAIYNHQVSKYGEKGHGGPTRQIYCVDRLSYPAFCSAMGWEDPPEFGEPRPTRKGPADQATRNQHTSVTPVKRNIMTRLGKQHRKDTPPVEEQPEVIHAREASYNIPLTSANIPLTSAALLRRTREHRRVMGAALADQMEAVKRHLSREPTGDKDEECAFHAEVELMRQAIARLCRE